MHRSKHYIVSIVDKSDRSFYQNQQRKWNRKPLVRLSRDRFEIRALLIDAISRLNQQGEFVVIDQGIVYRRSFDQNFTESAAFLCSREKLHERSRDSSAPPIKHFFFDRAIDASCSIRFEIARTLSRCELNEIKRRVRKFQRQSLRSLGERLKFAIRQKTRKREATVIRFEQRN